MYQIIYTKKFKKSFARLVRGGLKKSVQEQIKKTIDILALGTKLPQSYRDHQFHGELARYRECHVQGDLLLVYQIVNEDMVLVMVNIGTHNDLF